MRFRSGANLDTSQVSDRRGRGGAAAAGGGGLIGIVVLVFTLLNGGGDLSAIAPETLEDAGPTTDLAAECRTGADANAQDDCRIVGVVNSVQEYWQTNYDGYSDAQTVFFRSATNTACGGATSAVGPFYCPADESVYIDLGFYDDLRTSFGATGGPFAEAYVIAHEYGHHVQNITGVLGRSTGDEAGAESDSVRTELMADCYAGMWAQGATSTGFIEELTEQDIADGLNAASAIGDDRIQQRSQGQVDQESWTHGSSAQRQRWFTKGMQAQSMESCDTFAASRL